MFAPPPAVTAEIFTTIPEKYWQNGRKSEWARVQLHGIDTPTFLEGPAFDGEGNLWVTDIPWGRLFKITMQGEVTLGGDYDGQPNGMKFMPDGRALIADHHRGMMIFDPATGTVEPWITRFLLEPFLGCNDLTFAKNGDIYFTDQGQSGLHKPNGRLFRVRGDNGLLECLLDNIPSPNGLVLNKAETLIYLAVTRENAVWRVPIMFDGSVSKVGRYIQLSGGTAGPDGLAIDDEDNLVICQNGLGAVWLFSALGEPMLRINSPKGIYVTNAAYGGKDNKTLFITESKTGTILKWDMPVAGRALTSRTI
jgi:gluconolactonase